MTVINNGHGPTLVMAGGNHGDEYEGQIAISRLAREIEFGQIRGRLILLPMLNFPAAEAATRTSPFMAAISTGCFPVTRTAAPAR
ncbi:MAG: succinylglutamate desuccinylase/aspartoacylase family protein [Pseudomonadota bacterium]